MFEIYQSPPNETVNNGLIVPETNILDLNCAPWGEWNPKEVPRCIRKNINGLHNHNRKLLVGNAFVS